MRVGCILISFHWCFGWHGPSFVLSFVLVLLFSSLYKYAQHTRANIANSLCFVCPHVTPEPRVLAAWWRSRGRPEMFFYVEGEKSETILLYRVNILLFAYRIVEESHFFLKYIITYKFRFTTHLHKNTTPICACKPNLIGWCCGWTPDDACKGCVPHRILSVRHSRRIASQLLSRH